MVIIKNKEQIEGIRKSCKALAKVMQEVTAAVKPGISPKELNRLAEDLIAKTGGKPAFKGYPSHTGAPAFPSALCTSVNEQVVHGMGTQERPLEEGDIIGIDNGINLNGYYSDMAITVPVGEVSEEVKQLMTITKQSLRNGINAIKPGHKIRHISEAVERTIEAHGYGIVREFVGHGVGLSPHEDPMIPNYVAPHMKHDMNIDLKPGMILAIEPMITLGQEDVEVLDDGWTVVTKDGSYAAHYEHSVLVTEDGYEILTEL